MKIIKEIKDNNSQNENLTITNNINNNINNNQQSSKLIFYFILNFF